MIFQLCDQGWFVTDHLLPPGTIIDGENPVDPVTGMPLPLPLPLSARCLDQEALDAMMRWHSAEQHHRLNYDPSTIQPRRS